LLLPALVVGAVLSLLVPATPVRAATAVKEYEIKAVFLFNFAQFVEWPATAFADEASPVVIGVLGEDPFGEALDRAVQNETVKNRKVLVKRFRHLAELKGCHILFVSRSEKARLPQILEALKGQSVLMVGDMPDFTERGGVINFLLRANKVRFEINLRAAEDAELKISTKLIELGSIVGVRRSGEK